MKTLPLVRFTVLKTKIFQNVRRYQECVRRGLSSRPEGHQCAPNANFHTFSFDFEMSSSATVLSSKSPIFGTLSNFDLLFPFLATSVVLTSGFEKRDKDFLGLLSNLLFC